MISSDRPGRVDVGGVDEVDAGVEAHVDLARRAGGVGVADRGEVAAPAEGHGAEREDGDAQAGASEVSMFHAPQSSAWRPCGPRGIAPGRAGGRGSAVDGGEQRGVGAHEQGALLREARVVDVAARRDPRVRDVHRLGAQLRRGEDVRGAAPYV